MELVLGILVVLLVLAGLAFRFDRKQRRRGVLGDGDVAARADRLRSRDQGRGIGPTDSGWG